jgi:hypothetical protein
MKLELVTNHVGKPRQLLGPDVSHLRHVAKPAGSAPDVGEIPADRRDGAEGQQPLERRDEKERNLHLRRPFAAALLEDLVRRPVADPRTPDLRPIVGRTLIDLQEAGFRDERGDDERSVDQRLGDRQHLLHRFAADRQKRFGDALRVIPSKSNAEVVTKDEELRERVLEHVTCRAVITGVRHLGVGDERDPSIVDLADDQAHGWNPAAPVVAAACGKAKSTTPPSLTK